MSGNALPEAGVAAEPAAPAAESVAPPAPSPAEAQPAQRNPHLWRAFLAFLLPMMASNILQALSGTINNVYLGQMLGVRAMAAVSAFFPILFFFISFMIGLGSGASVLIGQAWGARERERVKAVAGTTLTVGLIVGLLVALFGGALTGPMLRLLHTPADILPSTTEYARIMLIAAPGIFVFLLVTSMLRGVSDTVSPLITLAVSTAIGLVLTPALIRGWGGLPRMGVASGAWAAVASYATGLAWLAWHMLRRNHPLAPDAVFLRHMKIDRAILARVLRIGLPTAMQVITMSLAEVAVLFLVNRFGSDATAAYGAVNQVMSYVQFPAMSIAITASILGAQAIGAGRTGTLGAIARTGILMNLVLTGSLVLLAYLFSRSLIGLFITSAPVVEITQTLLHIMLWSLIVYGMAAVLSGLMRASGTVLVPTGLSIFCILAVEIPVAWGMSHLIGLDGVWIGYPAAFIAMLLLQTGYYRLVWRKRPIRRL